MLRIVLLFLFLSTPALACAPSIPTEANTEISYPLDEALFNQVFLSYINAYRCQDNLIPLNTSRLLHLESSRHVTWMRENQKVSHTNTIRNRETPMDRIRMTRLRFTKGGENVARIAHYSVDSVPRFQLHGPCFFVAEGQVLGRRTYAQAASFMAAGYMQSPGHRLQIMDPTYKTTGMAVQLDPHGEFCGQLYHAQLFID